MPFDGLAPCSWARAAIVVVAFDVSLAAAVIPVPGVFSKSCKLIRPSGIKISRTKKSAGTVPRTSILLAWLGQSQLPSRANWPWPHQWWVLARLCSGRFCFPALKHPAPVDTTARQEPRLQHLRFAGFERLAGYVDVDSVQLRAIFSHALALNLDF